MQVVLLVIHVIISLLLVGIILIQRTNSDGLGGLGGGNNNNSLISSRASADFMTKTTAILAAIFMINSLVLANIAGRKDRHQSISDKVISSEKDKHHKPADSAHKGTAEEKPVAPIAR